MTYNNPTSGEKTIDHVGDPRNAKISDYTESEWRQNLFEGMTLEEISHAAMEYHKTLEPLPE
jgi:hypothetical protein